MSRRRSRVSVAAHEAPRLIPPGWSPLALQAYKTFSGKKRPKGWRGAAYGLVVHTTGRGLPKKAWDEDVYVTVMATRIYNTTRGCHYAVGYRGHRGGDLIQIAHEDVEAWGVGVSEPSNGAYAGQVESYRGKYRGSWGNDLPSRLVQRWTERWPGYSNPLDLLPGTRTANAPYLHAEFIPLTKEWMQEYEPWEGTLFTKEQHLTAAALACDVAERNDWGGEWWRTPRLLGHEDLTPITRHDKRGGWDPGHLRASPYWDWELVIEEIVRTWTEPHPSAIIPHHHQTKEPRPAHKSKGYYP